MAQKRMVNLEIVDTDAFLDMPPTTQNLYFHLNARGDDDGFVSNPNKIMRVVNAAVDDMRILVAKKFIISFNDGVCVIKHWRINNNIRKDIYKETNYLDHKKSLLIRGNGTYTQTKDDRAIPIPSGHFTIEKLHGDATSTQRRLSKGKVRLDKVRIEVPDWINKKAFAEFIEHRKNKKKKLTQRAANLVFKKFKDVSQKDQQKMVNNAIEGDWTTVYPLKKENKSFSSKEIDYRSQAQKDIEQKQTEKYIKDAAKTNPRIAEIINQKKQLTNKLKNN